jgi:glycyl-tRNA synthetase (class II)
VAKFADVLVKDLKTGQGYRADKVISEWIENRLEKGKINEEEKHELKKTLINIDGYTK